MIYGITENPRPTGKGVKYTPAAWGLSVRVKILPIIHHHTNLVCICGYKPPA